MKIRLISIFGILGLSLQAAVLTQTDTDYLVFDATQFDSTSGGWTQLSDTVTSPSLAGDVMVYADTNGIDAAASNASAAADTDKLNYVLDFISSGDYYLFVHIQAEFSGAGENDSMFIPSSSDWGGAADEISNTMGASSSNAYEWVRLSNTATARGAGVEGTSTINVNLYNVNATQAIGGNNVGFSIAGRENDLQLDRIVFHKDASVSATTLDSLQAIPEPSTMALLGIAFVALLYARRKR